MAGMIDEKYFNGFYRMSNQINESLRGIAPQKRIMEVRICHFIRQGRHDHHCDHDKIKDAKGKCDKQKVAPVWFPPILKQEA